MTIPPGASTGKVYVTPNSAEGIFIRSGAGPQFSPVASAFIGDNLELVDPAMSLAKVGVRGEWVQVRAATGATGWINARYVSQSYVETPNVGGAIPPQPPVIPPPVVQPPVVQPPAPPQPVIPMPPGVPPLYVHTTYRTGQFVRSGPGAQHPDIASINPPDKVEALGDRAANLSKLGKDGEWIQIKTTTGVVGWALAKLLELMPEVMVFNLGHALAGLHGPTEAWSDRWNDGAYNMLRDSRMEAVKMMASNDLLNQGAGRVTDIVNRLRGVGMKFILARLFAKFESPKSPRDFVNEVAPAAKALLAAGVSHFEVHNEPNLNIQDSREGMFVQWQNGREFGQFFQESVALLRQEQGMANAFFGFPGLSPNEENNRSTGRYPMSFFLNEADPVVRSADFVCMHNYWYSENDAAVQIAINEVRSFCQRYANKVIFVTEFANTHPTVVKSVKGHHYAKYYQLAKTLPANLGTVFSYAMRSAGDYGDQIWENSPIVQIVGSRQT